MGNLRQKEDGSTHHTSKNGEGQYPGAHGARVPSSFGRKCCVVLSDEDLVCPKPKESAQYPDDNG
jgi:hypothetical protein